MFSRWPVLAVLATALTLTAPSRATPGNNDGLSCGGRVVNLKETPEEVHQKCGAPSSSRSYERGSRTRWVIVVEWTYERHGSFPRLLTFEAGHLVSIEALGR